MRLSHHILSNMTGYIFQWDLVCDRRSHTKTMSTYFFLGVMLGAVVFGYLSDK